MKPLIVVDGLSKAYRANPAKTSMLDVWRGRAPSGEETFNVLKDLSFKVHEGEVLGLLGSNGAGKTTLLRILSSVNPRSGGDFQLACRPHAVLGLGNAFNPFMTGRENALREFTLYGLHGGELKNALAEAEDFSELGEFFDQQVHMYSTGMVARLAFSIVTAFHPRILLLDEALAVGDEYFRAKCKRRIREMLSSGAGAIIASHQFFDLCEFSTHMLWLQGPGKYLMGSVVEVASSYQRGNNQQQMAFFGKKIRIDDFTISSVGNDKVRCEARVTNLLEGDMAVNVLLGFIKNDDFHRTQFVTKTMLEVTLPPGVSSLTLENELPLPGGEYLINLMLSGPQESPNAHGRMDASETFDIRGWGFNTHKNLRIGVDDRPHVLERGLHWSVH